MKSVIRILALSALLVAAVQAVTPQKQDLKLKAENGGYTPLCMPRTNCNLTAAN